MFNDVPDQEFESIMDFHYKTKNAAKKIKNYCEMLFEDDNSTTTTNKDSFMKSCVESLLTTKEGLKTLARLIK